MRKEQRKEKKKKENKWGIKTEEQKEQKVKQKSKLKEKELKIHVIYPVNKPKKNKGSQFFFWLHVFSTLEKSNGIKTRLENTSYIC